MDIFFQDPTAIPLPPNEVRIIELQAEPWSDNRRVGIYLEVTPFQKRPNGEVTITNPDGDIAAHASIIETIVTKMELTLHLRSHVVSGKYTVSASIFYVEEAPEDEEDKTSDFTDPRRRMQVDTKQAVFEINQSTDP